MAAAEATGCGCGCCGPCSTGGPACRSRYFLRYPHPCCKAPVAALIQLLCAAAAHHLTMQHKSVRRVPGHFRDLVVHVFCMSFDTQHCLPDVNTSSVAGRWGRPKCPRPYVLLAVRGNECRFGTRRYVETNEQANPRNCAVRVTWCVIVCAHDLLVAVPFAFCDRPANELLAFSNMRDQISSQ